jgi:hypothetical protein
LDGAADLKRYLTEQRSPDFIRHVTKRMLTYALGRELNLPDERPVLEILDRLRRSGNGAKSLVHAIVLSDPFRNRMNSTQ